MTCTKCNRPIEHGQAYHKTRRGPHHRDCAAAATAEVVGWAQAVLTALNVGDVQSGSKLHLKLREVMIAYRASIPEDNNQGESLREQALRNIKAVHTRFCRGEMTANNAVDEMEAIAVSVWQREELTDTKEKASV